MKHSLLEDDKKKLVGNQKEIDANNDGEISAEDFELLREQKQEGGMMDEMPEATSEQMSSLMEKEEQEDNEMQSDEEMENDYLDYIIGQALDEDEEDFLMQQLMGNDRLSEVFDKVIEVASEFSGSGSVEGPGTGVSDSIPARLSDGEFVFTAKAVSEIGADNLMSAMKEAEARADQRLSAQEGGAIREEMQQEAGFAQPQETTQNIRVTRETVDNQQSAMQDQEDLVGENIRSQMMLDPYQRHVRS
tara:strand:- start:1031 stop:1771 length:741 start_codon:yes stop_codon:yes gene_type:complete